MTLQLHAQARTLGTHPGTPRNWRAFVATNGLNHWLARIEVVHGSFEDIPASDGAFDVVWSQDAILHSGDRTRALDDVAILCLCGTGSVTRATHGTSCFPRLFNRKHQASRKASALPRRQATPWHCRQDGYHAFKAGATQSIQISALLVFVWRLLRFCEGGGKRTQVRHIS